MKTPNLTGGKGRVSKFALLSSGALLVALAGTAPALAQNNQAEVETDQKKPDSATDAIVITGSRIARKDYTATSPIVTVDSELLEKSSSISLEANLNKLPQFSPALSQFTTADIQANANNTIGISTVSLRQLGANRNLVLIDGRRPTPINGTGVVDINSIPSSAIDRVEIITGGASSTYGADAVGGVVNFILKKNFQGVNVDGQIGQTQRNDGREYRLSLLFGANIAGDRGNIMIGMERYNRDLVHRANRPWYDSLYRNPNIAGTETFIAENFVSFPGGAFPTQACVTALFQGGTCNAQTLSGKNAPKTVALPSGASANLTVSNLSSLYVNPTSGSLFVNTSTTVGSGSDQTYVPELFGYTGGIDGLSRKLLSTGVRSDNNLDEYLSSSQNRWTFFGRANYDISDNVTMIGQASFARTQVPSLLLYTVAINAFATPIPHGSDIYTGNAEYGIPSSLNADGTTNVNYRTGGKYGLNCPVTGGCTNSQVFPVPSELATLLDGRATTNTTVNGVTAPQKNQPFYMNVVPSQLGRRVTDNNNNVFQLLAGFEGKIPGTDWTWDATAAHGETVAKVNQDGLVSVGRFHALMQAPNYGYGFSTVGDLLAPGLGRNGANASCTSGLNPFQQVTWSADCVSALTVKAQNENRLTQDQAEANVQGGLVDLPYGQLRFALGADYRKTAINFTPDSSATEGASFREAIMGIFPQGNTKGSISVKEVYGELLVPLLSNLPFAKALNLELGYRYSDYNTSGATGTYKLNGEWAPFNWLRFRGGYQKASRAPNLGELFTAATETFTFGGDGDPCSRGNTVSPVSYGNYSANPIGLDSNLNPSSSDTVGNPDAAKVEALCRTLMGSDAAAQYYRSGKAYSTAGAFATAEITGNSHLHAETAKTYTIGAVINAPSQNPWLSRLRLSVDYYNVDLTDGIAQQSVDVVYRLCFSKIYNPNYDLTPACHAVVRDPTTGDPGLIQLSYSNGGRVQVSGIDAQADWGLTFKDVGIGLPGSFRTNVQFSYLDHFKTTTDQTVLPLIDYSGTLGGGEVGTDAGAYRWKLFTTFGYTVGPFNVSMQWQHKPAVASVQSVTSTTSHITGAPAYDLFNLSGSFTITRTASLRFGVDNLFDRAPPLQGVNLDADPTKGQLPGGSYNASQYDVLGRRFYVGASYKF